MKIEPEQLLRLLKVRFEAADQVRRGVCLLNAGQYERAEAAFARAAEAGCTDRSLPSYLAACLLGQGMPEAAASHFAETARQDDTQTAARIRHALAQWSAGKCDAAIQSLRESIRLNPEFAELHFQLGLLLTSLEDYDEAELRFTQALNIERDHTEALVSLALCCGVRNAMTEALGYLQRAQSRKPHDARIGQLLTQAAKAVQQQGLSVRARADMPDGDPVDDEQGIEELSRVIEAEPDFVDAFLSIPIGQVDERVFAMLLKTLEAALERQPEHAELHYHCGRVLARVGRSEDAINENERAISIAPTFIHALIELARLYQKTDRNVDATTRLEQAVAAGAEYADVYYLLGNLYRDQGQVGRARSAYRRALVLNDRYEAAVKALEALPTT
ncbi:MAG: tetratricopeptide repeat protein [Phycisphaerae bacterium]